MEINPGAMNIGNRNNQSGSIMVVVSIFLTCGVFFALAALAIDIGYIYGVRGELQKAADTAALAGATELYHSPQSDPADPTVSGGDPANRDLWGLVNRQINIEAIATNMAISHVAAGKAVEVESVHRGHWEAGSGTFTACEAEDCGEADASRPNLSLFLNVLDITYNFVNAVQVTTRTTAPSLFGRGIGVFNDYTLRATAIAYIGFAGTLHPREVDQPLAVYLQKLHSDTASYDCTTTRMISGKPNPGPENSGAWVDFNHPSDSAIPGNPSEDQIKELISCRASEHPKGNTSAINLGSLLPTKEGGSASFYSGLIACFGVSPVNPWRQNVLVIDPEDSGKMQGVVAMNIVWVTTNDDKEMSTPVGDWSCSGTWKDCWPSFAEHFKLTDENQSALDYEPNTIYYRPECKASGAAGMSGGKNFGIVARIPVLVH